MSQDNNTIELKKYKHLKERQRYTIEDLLKEGLKPREIAVKTKKSVRTIQREIVKGKVKLLNSDLTFRIEYCADRGQQVYEENSKNKGPNLKIGKDHKLAKYIENKIINENHSPDAVIGEIGAKGLIFIFQNHIIKWSLCY